MTPNRSSRRLRPALTQFPPPGLPVAPDRADFDREPTPTELTAIRDEMPVIDAEVELLDARIAILDRDATELDRQRIRRAQRRLLKARAALTNRTDEAGGAA